MVLELAVAVGALIVGLIAGIALGVAIAFLVRR